ncbi:MAG: glycosyltransferase family 4 protein [Phycicoccus sp.]|nr:glycosyltransferase family 4 protein [Phycicoccus sp.]
MSEYDSAAPSPSALRIAVVGPTHPLKGGVAAHTTTLASALADAGHDVSLVAWSHLYPSLLYPGEQAVPGGTPEVPPFPRTVRALSWARPDTWLRAGLRLRQVDAIIVVHVVPQVVPAHLALLKAARALRVGRAAPVPRSIVVAHNVLPHESRPGDRRLVGSLLSRVDSIVVHGTDQAIEASQLGAHHVRVLDLPPHLPGGERRPVVEGDGRTRVLALGIVREYKGVDLLVEAVREVPEVTLTVAGELWGAAGERVRQLAADPTLRGRVIVESGYVPAARISELMARHDVLALTYRHATASQNVLLAQHHGLTVLATDVGTFANQVRDGVDGLVVPAEDKSALVAALRRLAVPGYAARLRSAVPEPDLSSPWAHYVGGIEALATIDADAVGDPPGGDREGEDPAGLKHSLPVALVEQAMATGRHLVRQVAARRRAAPPLALGPASFPEWVRATDVLAQDDQAREARATARELGLPRSPDAVAAWSALGAIAAIVKIRDGGRRTSLVVDESGSGSPFSRWARALGFEPVDLDLTGIRSSVAALDVDPASIDVLVRVHPGGCSADDIDIALGQASWALRPGGLLIVTVPIGDNDPQWSVTPADVRGILARADDLGLVLVGEFDGELTRRLRAAGASTRERREAQGEAPASEPDAAYGVLRLTFRSR